MGAVCLGQVLGADVAGAEGPDPQRIVIDEVAGVWLTFFGIRMTTPRCFVGAAVFRALDKLKPGPVGFVDRQEGRWSVMADDLLAGGVANVVLRAGIAAVAGHR